MAVANSTLSVLHSPLRIEVLFEGSKLILLEHAALPPRLNEAEAVAHQLGKGSGNTEETNLEALVLDGRVGKKQ